MWSYMLKQTNIISIANILKLSTMKYYSKLQLMNPLQILGDKYTIM